MPDTEKVTINLSVVDVGKIDYLVSQGFYSNRTDFVRTAIRQQLQGHDVVVEQAITRKAFAMGVMGYNQRSLQRYRDAGEQLELRVVGLLVFESDVTPDLVRDVVRSLELYGVLRAPAGVKEVLADKMI